VATYDTLGKPLGDAIFALQKSMGDAFKAAHPSDGPLDPVEIAASAAAFAKLLSEETSKLLIQYMVAYAGKVTTAPNTGDGQDYPIPTVLMQVDESDGFVAVWWKSGPVATDWRNLLGGGTGFPGYWDAPTTPIGSNDPGDSPLVSRGNHSHEGQDPAVVESTLHTAVVPDPRNHGQVACVYAEPGTGEFAELFIDWTEIATGVMQRNTFGLLTSTFFDGVDPAPAYGRISSLIGKSVIAYRAGLCPDKEKGGIYIIDDVGASWQHAEGDPPDVFRLVSTYARMHRAPDYSFSSQFVQNMTFQVQTGNTYGTDFLTLTNASVVLGTTEITWDLTEGPTFPWVQDRYCLLTGPQLTSEGASKETRELVATRTNGDTLLQKSFFTLIGTPGLDAVPAGIWKSDNESVYLDAPGSPGSITTLRWKIYNGTTFEELFVMESSPISTIVPAALSFQYLDSGHSFSPTDYLEATPWLHTTSTTPVTLHLRYSSPGHGTRFTVPFALAITGAATGRHNDLSGRGIGGDKDVASTDSTKDDTCHPWSALGPAGRMHMKMGVATLTGSGTTRKLVMPADCSVAKLVPTTNEVIYGIDRSGFSAGGMDTSDEIRILVAATPTFTACFVHENSGMGGDAMHVSDDGENVEFDATGFVRFARDPTTGTDGIWRRL
jgi:hypothetical protein